MQTFIDIPSSSQFKPLLTHHLGGPGQPVRASRLGHGKAFGNHADQRSRNFVSIFRRLQPRPSRGPDGAAGRLQRCTCLAAGRRRPSGLAAEDMGRAMFAAVQNGDHAGPDVDVVRDEIPADQPGRRSTRRTLQARQFLTGLIAVPQVAGLGGEIDEARLAQGIGIAQGLAMPKSSPSAAM